MFWKNMFISNMQVIVTIERVTMYIEHCIDKERTLSKESLGYLYLVWRASRAVERRTLNWVFSQ